MVLDHAAIVGIHPFLAKGLQTKLDSAAGWQVGNGHFQF